MATVQLLDRTYTLPEVASVQFHRLQEQVRARQRLIQEGVKSQPRLLGLIPRTPVRLSEEERLHELDLLVRDYDAIIAGLREGRGLRSVLRSDRHRRTASRAAQERRDTPTRTRACCLAGVGGDPAGHSLGAMSQAE